ncbi:MAG TPA: EscU/YscU/HrcU family type III secretion system export apparatus switch protein [Phycisphaerae bacterium]|nr:EscU/YscU/HrcU family type III secretion system export apparatus switch protein [Phycisphaerae bacterium]
MARRDDIGERTELPTALRLEEAKRRGQVPRSADLVAAATALGAMALLWALGGALLGELVRLTGAMLDVSTAGQGPRAAWAGLPEALGRLALRIAPLLGAALLLAVLANAAQVGLRAVGENVSPDLGRLSPAAGLRRMFSARSAWRASLAVVKVVAAGTLAVLAFRSALPALARAEAHGAAALARTAGDAVGRCGIAIGAVLAVLGGADYLFQRWQHVQDLRMTRREVLEDLRQTQGDPAVRRRRRKLAAGAVSELTQLPREERVHG